MWTRVKVCGIKDLQDAWLCADAGVEFLGLNFYPESPRFVSWQTATQIAREISGTVRLVGLFVQPQPPLVFWALWKFGLSAVQLYGVPQNSWPRFLPVPVFWPGYASNGFGALKLQRRQDWLLLDSQDKKLLGGTGKVFRWEEIPADLPRQRLILAGGLQPENIRLALERVNPAIVDVASGVETSPGKKDPIRLRAFVKEVMRFNLEKMQMEAR